MSSQQMYVFDGISSQGASINPFPCHQSLTCSHSPPLLPNTLAKNQPLGGESKFGSHPTVQLASARRKRLPKHQRRSVLDVDIVLSIFAQRPPRGSEGTYIPCAKLARELCEAFRVKERTVRDIWNRKTWASITRPLCNHAEIAAEDGPDPSNPDLPAAQPRKKGRPVGARDTVKRKKAAPKEVSVSMASQEQDRSSLNDRGPSKASAEHVDQALSTVDSCFDQAEWWMLPIPSSQES